jgi:hypothetical protein
MELMSYLLYYTVYDILDHAIFNAFVALSRYSASDSFPATCFPYQHVS